MEFSSVDVWKRKTRRVKGLNGAMRQEWSKVFVDFSVKTLSARESRVKLMLQSHGLQTEQLYDNFILPPPCAQWLETLSHMLKLYFEQSREKMPWARSDQKRLLISLLKRFLPGNPVWIFFFRAMAFRLNAWKNFFILFCRVKKKRNKVWHKDVAHSLYNQTHFVLLWFCQSSTN